MRRRDLDLQMIGITELKKNLSYVVDNSEKMLIVKNNTPVSVLVPYGEYIILSATNDEVKKLMIETNERMVRMGQDIDLEGLQVLVTTEVGGMFGSKDLVLKTHYKIPGTDDYRHYHTFSLGRPYVPELEKGWEKPPSPFASRVPL